MGGKSKTATAANTTTNTTNTQNVASTSVGLEDVEFGAVAGGDLSVTQIQSDQGAIEKSFDAIESGTKLSLGFADSIGGKAIDAVTDANDRSLDFGDEVVERGFSFGSQALDSVTAFGGKALDSVTQNSAKTSAELGAAIDRAAAASRSDSSQSLNMIVKYGAYALGAVAAAIAIYSIFKKRG